MPEVVSAEERFDLTDSLRRATSTATVRLSQHLEVRQTSCTTFYSPSTGDLRLVQQSARCQLSQQDAEYRRIARTAPKLLTMWYRLIWCSLEQTRASPFGGTGQAGNCCMIA